MLIATMLALALTADPDAVVTTARHGEQAPLPDAVAPTAPDAPTTTVQTATPHGLTTAEQIDRWIGAGARDEQPFSRQGAPWIEGDDRQMHGFVTAGIGTNDYSSVGVGVSLPLGENGRVNLCYSQTKNGWGYPYGYGGGYGGGYGYGHAYDPAFGSGSGCAAGYGGGPLGWDGYASEGRWSRTRIYEQAPAGAPQTPAD